MKAIRDRKFKKLRKYAGHGGEGMVEREDAGGRREAPPPRAGKLPWLEEGCTLAKLRSCEQSASERLVDDQRRALCTLQVHIDSWSNLFLGEISYSFRASFDRWELEL